MAHVTMDGTRGEAAVTAVERLHRFASFRLAPIIMPLLKQGHNIYTSVCKRRTRCAISPFPWGPRRLDPLLNIKSDKELVHDNI
jgi:hypothetical protein